MPPARPGTLACAFLRPALLLLSACPNIQLASLNPCTVSSASIRVDQGGVSDVDLLFVIDNSGSMASEQEKLAAQLPKLVNVLISGDRSVGTTPPAGVSDDDRFFTPVKSLHIGVVSSSMGGQDKALGNGVALNDCVGLGDDGVLLKSTNVAVEGVYAEQGEFPDFARGDEVLAPLPGCDDIGAQPGYQRYEAGGDVTADELAQNFACVARLGVRGCPFEQQLEAMWKAVAPSDGDQPDLHVFLDGTRGHGDPNGRNQGFVRENAILAVIQVSDEEDCSINQQGKPLFADDADAQERFGGREKINLRCGQFGDAEGLLWPAQRYVRGLKSLKPNNPDLVIFAAIVGIPEDAINQPLADVLERTDMKFAADPVRTNLPRTSCISSSGDEAYPPRRFLEVAQGFGTDAVVYSICADNYAPALDKLIERIASKLSGNCLPQPLVADEDGLVRCEVFEILPLGKSACDPEHGHDAKPIKRPVDGKERSVCHMEQVPVFEEQPKAGVKGWYYDDFDKELEECQPGQKQRISFSFGQLPSGGGAFIECFRPVARIDPLARGQDAVNTDCRGDAALCATRSNGDYQLFCTPDNTCQIECENTPDCPRGWVCGTKQGSGVGDLYCQLPTCPADDAQSAP
jgi:hypothetical protein